MTEVPPSRYRVVERGRRLEVVDTMTGASTSDGRVCEEPVDRLEMPLSRGVDSPSSLRPVRMAPRAGGGRTVTTNLLYDEKGPRTLMLDQAGTTVFGRTTLALIFLAMILVLALIWQPWLVVLPIIAFSQARPRKAIRHKITAWLDRYDTLGK